LYSDELVYGKSQGLGVEIILCGKPSIGGWREKNSSRDVEGIMRHPSLVLFFHLSTGLGKITVG